MTNYGSHDSRIRIRSPGRANLMGDHTDYAGGLVLPVAIDQHILLEARPRNGLVALVSDAESDQVQVSLKDGAGPERGWGRYVTGVVRQLQQMGFAIAGFEGELHSHLPIGGGLSSSAALEVAVALALLQEPVDARTVADACHLAENNQVGVPCGVMDQCRLITELLEIDSLREVDEGSIRKRKSDLGDMLFRRARHFVTENDRVLKTRSALTAGDTAALSDLFAESHQSLSADLDVATPDIDLLQQCAQQTEGVIGARLTGGGFGGCIVALIRKHEAQTTVAEVVGRYEAASGKRTRAWISEAADGASRD